MTSLKEFRAGRGVLSKHRAGRVAGKEIWAQRLTLSPSNAGVLGGDALTCRATTPVPRWCVPADLRPHHLRKSSHRLRYRYDAPGAMGMGDPPGHQLSCDNAMSQPGKLCNARAGFVGATGPSRTPSPRVWGEVALHLEANGGTVLVQELEGRRRVAGLRGHAPTVPAGDAVAMGPRSRRRSPRAVLDLPRVIEDVPRHAPDEVPR